MKVFIKSLLIISLLSGNISYAENKQNSNSKSKILREAQGELERLDTLRYGLNHKKILIEEYIKKNGKVRKNATKAAVWSSAGVTLVASAVAVYGFRGMRQERTLPYVLFGASSPIALFGGLNTLVAMGQMPDTEFYQNLENGQRENPNHISNEYQKIVAAIAAIEERILKIEELLMHETGQALQNLMMDSL
ncbi:MAG: hypothetical protein V4596_13775 [Bdellovibrionota bacterium]